ncbi:unnamed protein product [Ixodes pacificus]
MQFGCTPVWVHQSRKTTVCSHNIWTHQFGCRSVCSHTSLGPDHFGHTPPHRGIRTIQEMGEREIFRPLPRTVCMKFLKQMGWRSPPVPTPLPFQAHTTSSTH